ncbi:MAG: hypothetical protein WA825_07325 [Steroidobacteraceae bacterium]
MGLYDEIRCEVPLPDGGRIVDVKFQTKTFPCPGMQRYVITRAGRLVDSLGNDLEPDGYITFYASEVDSASACAAGHIWREYRARFSAGQVLSIVCVAEEEQASRTRYGLASFRWFSAPSFLLGDPSEE